MHDLYLKVLTVHNNPLLLFWAKPFPDNCCTLSDIGYIYLNVINYDAVRADIQTCQTSPYTTRTIMFMYGVNTWFLSKLLDPVEILNEVLNFLRGSGAIVWKKTGRI